jgi:hypothetical protein
MHKRGVGQGWLIKINNLFFPEKALDRVGKGWRALERVGTGD